MGGMCLVGVACVVVVVMVECVVVVVNVVCEW